MDKKNEILRQIVHDWLPPAIANGIRKIISNQPEKQKDNVVWNGDYTTWEEALAASEGYTSENILQKVKASTLKVKNGEAAYERDSAIFDEIHYSWAVLSGLMWTAARHGGRLDVLDFGGSLGSSYFQNRKFLSGLSEVHWSVVEQPHFVDCGREFIQDDYLHFYSTIEECLFEKDPNVVLLSGVLSHLSDWLSLLQTILDKRISTIIVDRTPFVLSGKERITVQTVPEWIYTATYPCRFLDESKFIQIFEEHGYQMVENFVALDKANIPSVYKGFIFIKEL
jgi:putative methyltransferase (TIGR04325 family)